MQKVKKKAEGFQIGHFSCFFSSCIMAVKEIILLVGVFHFTMVLKSNCLLLAVTHVALAGTPWVERCRALLALRVTSAL